jgi:uncharacterized protein
VQRVVIDTNVWISAFLAPRGACADVLSDVLNGKLLPIVSVPLIEELTDVLARPRLVRKYGFEPDEVRAYIALIRVFALEVPVTGSVHICRDPDDDSVIETAVAGRAAFLLTRDDDLKDAPEVAAILGTAGVDVLTVRRILELLLGTDAGDAPESERSG